MILSKQSRSSNFSSEAAAILTTLAYADIFNFPLKQDELWQYLISDKGIQKKRFLQSLETIKPQVSFKDGYYTLKNKERTIQKRIKNLGEVARKQALASKAANIISKIPTVQFIGISGALAARNIGPEDDIDLFIILKKEKIFVSRFWMLLFLEMLGVRRTRNQKNAANKICINLLIDASSMRWSPEKRDIYTAHEIAQIQPLFEREDMYNRFLQENLWVQSLLPNAYETKKVCAIRNKETNKFFQIIGSVMTSFPFEIVMRYVQKMLINRHKTTETVTDHLLAFHPRDYRAETLELLSLKMRHLGLLTKE